MSTEVKKEIQLEIAHVLFSDIVGYSKLLINEQRAGARSPDGRRTAPAPSLPIDRNANRQRFVQCFIQHRANPLF